MAVTKGLYKVQYQPSKSPDSSKPYCIVNVKTGTINGRWYATKAKADDALKAMYANMGSKATYTVKGSGAKNMAEHDEKAYLSPLKEFAANWIDGNKLWVQQYPYDKWTHPFYSDTTIDHETATRLKESFDNKTYNDRYFASFEHGLDVSKGDKASGEVLELKVIDEARGAFTAPGLWALVQFTEPAVEEINKGEWNYWSAEHYDEWTHPQKGETSELVYRGGSLTNKPWVKGMAPLNFSEVGIEDPKEFADWSTAYKNSLPDSAFLHIEPGGTKDSSGKTVPRSKRHFPVKNSSGAVDLIHVRAAIAMAPKANLPSNVKSGVQAKARRLLSAKSYSELLEVMDCDWQEFTDPGGAENPLISPDDNDLGNRIDTPPPGEDGTVPDRSETVTKGQVDEGGEIDVNEEELRKILGIGEETDIKEAVQAVVDEVTPLREALKTHSEKKQFSELFPAEFERMERLEAESRDNAAKRFAESVGGHRLTRKVGEADEETTLGYSALVVDKIEEYVKAFSENRADLTMFSEVMNTITNNGIVDYGTRGSSREDEKVLVDSDAPKPGTVLERRKAFSDKVTEIMEKDSLDLPKALELAAKTYPELARDYRTAGVAE